MSTKTQPEEEHVLSAIQRVLDQNPDFGVKRVATVLKEQNPDWTISEKRVTKLLKKHKSSRISIAFDGANDDSDSTGEDSPKVAAAPSPWNLAPATAVVEQGWTQVAPPVVPEPVAEPEAAAHNPWNVAPVHEKTFTETVKEHVSNAVETVKETTSEVIAAAPGAFEKAKDAVVDAAEDAKDKAEDIVDDIKDKAEDIVDATPGFVEKVKHAAADAVESVKETASNVADKVSETASDAVDAVKEATSSAPSPWNVSVEDKSFTATVTDSVKSAAATVAATATAGVAAVKEAVADASEAGHSAWNAAPVEQPVYVAEPVKELVTPVVAVPAVEEPKKEAWNFTTVKEDAEKVAEALEESAKNAVEKVEAAASVAADKIKEESAAAVVVLKKAESAVEDKLHDAKVKAESFVGYESASVATKKDKSARVVFPEKEQASPGFCGLSCCATQ
ncbi:hypothetical protein FI667_g15011, partial [Globisporangium splendens]